MRWNQKLNLVIPLILLYMMKGIFLFHISSKITKDSGIFVPFAKPSLLFKDHTQIKEKWRTLH